MDEQYEKSRYSDILYHLLPKLEGEARFNLANILDRYALEVIINAYLQEKCYRISQDSIYVDSSNILIDFTRDNDGKRVYHFRRAMYGTGSCTTDGTGITTTHLLDDLGIIEIDNNFILKLITMFIPGFNIANEDNRNMKFMLSIERYIDSESDNAFRTLRMCHDVHCFAFAKLKTIYNIERLSRKDKEDGKEEESKIRVVKNRPY
jgi:hypothetical protein